MKPLYDDDGNELTDLALYFMLNSIIRKLTALRDSVRPNYFFAPDAPPEFDSHPLYDKIIEEAKKNRENDPD